MTAITDDFDPMESNPYPNLPWFVNRLMSDEWSFGLYLTDGTLLGVTHLNAVRFLDGEAWLDVSLMPQDHSSNIGRVYKTVVQGSPTERLSASVNVRHVMYVIELADT